VKRSTPTSLGCLCCDGGSSRRCAAGSRKATCSTIDAEESAVASSYTEELRHRAHAGDEFTGDPRVRDLWEKTRYERHLLIRSMHGDPWAESTWTRRIGIVLGNSFFWIVAVPFLWAALLMMIFVAVAVVMALAGCDQPVESYLGTGGSGGVGDYVVGGSLVLAVLVASFAVWGRTAGNDAEIRRLRGLSNTDLLHEHDRWREQKAREAEAARREHEAWEHRREADCLAERIGDETRRAVYQAGIELEKFHDFSERIAGRRR
jgi:hypothetical protein